MPLAQFSFGLADTQSPNGGLPLLKADGLVCEKLTPGGSAVATTAVAPTPVTFGSPVCRVAVDVSCYVAFGAAPVASATTGIFMPANAVEHFALKPGDKASVLLA